MKFLSVLIAFLFVFRSGYAQFDRSPYWSHHERGDLILTAGYQQFNLQAGTYEAYSVNLEYMADRIIGIRGDVAFGRDYLSFAPTGLAVNALMPFFMNASKGNTLQTLLICLGGLSSLQFHIPICEFMEANCGWNSLKITKLKSISDTYYINGGIGVGVSFIFNNIIINPYYEYNYNYYWLSNKFNDWFRSSIAYSQWFNGHTFGVKMGFRFNNALRR